ncbi:hypothetical protein [Agrobacterium pusense]|uniref:hypothetical protein n=1 Tax=Agrobacterium pusense TaxID=648995 RepID=UPI0028A63922|nr:hypothetical protein [Agrobacterium pusense]
MIEPSLQEQEEAFQRYAEAVRKVEKTLDFADGRAAKDAWVAFLNLYLPDARKVPDRAPAAGNVLSLSDFRAT